MLESALAPANDVWSSRVALAGHQPADESAMRSHVAAMNAYRALEAALRGVEDLSDPCARERLASPLFAAMMCAYTVLDTPARSAAHGDGLREGQRLVADARAALRELAQDETVERVAERLAAASACLWVGSESLAELGFEAPPISLEFFLADTYVSDYSEGA